MALEHRLLTESNETGVSLSRLRRRVLFERVVARLEAAEPGCWVVKGGMALEVRLRDEARLTKDIDLGLRDDIGDASELHERVTVALASDLDGDGFRFVSTRPTVLGTDGGRRATWRARVESSLAGKEWGSVHLDVSPRPYELDRTDRVPLSNVLQFADVPAPVVEIVDVNRHAAEKLHALSRDYGDVPNSRVRDLLDLVLLIEHQLLDPSVVATLAVAVWAERDAAAPPDALPPLPAGWPARYEQLAADYDVAAAQFNDAHALVTRLWSEMFPKKEP